MKKTLLFTIFFLSIDQLSKWAILTIIDLDRIHEYEVFPPVLNFYIGWNKGINFGLLNFDLSVMRWVLISVSIMVCGALLMWSRRFNKTIISILFGMIIGGALGNVIDRLWHGAVVDFINISCCGIQNPYVFNIADIFICFGLLNLALFLDKLSKQT